jgi:hypothetical protein
MAAHSPQDVTQLLKAWSNGEQEALEQLIPLVYQELHRLAHRYMGRERDAHTLQSTALVHEAYERLIGLKDMNWQNRAHFFGVSAQLMRRMPAAGGEPVAATRPLEKAVTHRNPQFLPGGRQFLFYVPGPPGTSTPRKRNAWLPPRRLGSTRPTAGSFLRAPACCWLSAWISLAGNLVVIP